MKMNLKKAISAVIALAVAGSMIPASFAAKVTLTDVADTASYATAVNTLVALGVINGYEDNTFLPDNLITRAEASKVIVAALNETASAEGMKGATKFSDIEAKHEWATGYINKGVSMGYINGMEDNKFGPDANVTYAQVIKMMMVAMGYEDYAASLAQQNGYTGANWYIPYTSLASDAGITDGVSANPNDAVTRAQVAQLVYNAVKAPIVKNVGISYTDGGKIVPKIQVQDGSGSGSDKVYYKSILTEKFDAYFVEGYVLETSKDGAGLEADQVKFGVAKSEWYDNTDVQSEKTYNNISVWSDSTTGNEGPVLTPVYVGDTDAAENKGVYSSAIIMQDEYDDYVLIDFIASGKNKTVTFDLDLLDTEAYEDAQGNVPSTAPSTYEKSFLKFYANHDANTSTKYLLDTVVEIYVNGVKMTDANALWKYVISNEIGEVELVDTYKTNGKYDTIYVSAYETAMVDYVDSNDKVWLKNGNFASVNLNTEDNDKLVYNIYYNGENVEIASLQEDDVVSIAYDLQAGFANSNFYDIYVSRDVVTDTLGGKNTEDETAKFGDTYYPFLSGFTTFANNSKLGDEYTVYLDAFGRIYKTELNSSAANWAVIDKAVWSDTYEDLRLTLFTADGTEKTYTFDSNKAEVTKADGSIVTKNNSTTAAQVRTAVTTLVGTSGNKTDITGRVIQYKVNSTSGKVTALKFMPVKTQTDDSTTTNVVESAEFKARNNSIGGIKLSDATKIIDAIEYVAKDEDLAAASLASLIDEVPYVAYAYGDKIDGIHPFVLVTKGEAGYNSKTRFAVVTKDGASQETDDAGNEIYRIDVLYGAETEYLYANDDMDTVAQNLVAGEVFFFTTDSNGYIDDIDVIFNFADNSGKIAVPAQKDLAAWSLVDGNTTYTNLQNIFVESTFGGDFSSDFTTDWDKKDTDAIKLVYGPIVEKTDNDVSFGKVANGKTDLTTVSTFDFANDIRTYTYDYSQGSKSRFACVNNSSAPIRASRVTDAQISADEIDWTTDADNDGNKDSQVNANFAFALVVEDEIVDILVFLSK